MRSHIVIMGVSGSGKTTLGSLLAPELGLPYMDGDDLHPQANIEKMSVGIPLTDIDRAPWLAEVGRWLAEHPDGGIIGCSALKRIYRDQIRSHCPKAVFLHVHGSFDLLMMRMSNRTGHFMPASLLKSQFDTLQPLEADEVGIVLDVALPPQELAQAASDWLAALK